MSRHGAGELLVHGLVRVARLSRGNCRSTGGWLMRTQCLASRLPGSRSLFAILGGPAAVRR